MLDASTSAAIAALVVALAAFIIALAQVLQQYFSTGQGIRMCDSVVFGGMPGKGRRLWQLSQFRFRVVYSIPQIGLPPHLWPRDWPSTFKTGKHRLPNFSGMGEGSEVSHLMYNEKNGIPNSPRAVGRFGGGRRKAPKSLDELRRGTVEGAAGSKPLMGEASWASFCRIMHYSCRNCVRFDFVENDIDRCPSDLPTVPMQLSARDVIIIGLTVGMKCTEASFATKTLCMQGTSGIITSSQHPILGPLLHFTPGNMEVFHGIADTGSISMQWLGRVWGVWPVAGSFFNRPARRSVEKYAGIWIQRIKTSKEPGRGLTVPQPPSKIANIFERKKKVEIKSELSKTTPVVKDDRPLAQRIGFHDGLWSLVIPVPPPPPPPIISRKSKQPSVISVPHPLQHLGKPQRGSVPFQATVEDAEQDDTLSSGLEHSHNVNLPMQQNGQSTIKNQLQEIQAEAHKLQAERNARAAKIAEDEKTVAKLEVEGRIPDRISGQLLLTWNGEGSSKSKDKQRSQQIQAPTAKEQEAFDREAKRREQREQRAKRDADRQARSDEQSYAIANFGQVNWFWLSQTDIVPGFWATLWRPFQDLDPQICTGAVICILSALQGFNIEGNLIRYYDLWDRARGHRYTRPTIEWMLNGQCTFPGYAHNGRGGVVCSGLYPSVKCEVFKDEIPVIELLHSYEYQIQRFRPSDQKACEEELVELMRIDAWLSLCGRTDEITNGRNELLKQTPAMVQLLLREFSYDFLNLELSDLEGGAQVNKALADNVMDFLLDEELSGAEQLYVLVATLRAVKVGQCILDGQDTAMLEHIVREDMQVHLV